MERGRPSGARGAARLLVELGMTPTEAIAAVRKARPNTIETPNQERHIRKTVAINPALSFMRRTIPKLDP